MVGVVLCSVFAAANHSLADDFGDASQPSQQPSKPSAKQEVVLPALPNAKRLCDQVWVGGQPESQLAFDQLAEQGIRVIISVDGAAPEVDQAKRAGLRYVHLPIGYDGIDESRATALSAALVQLPGPFYVHCHHGRHRAPAAAAVACIRTGLVSSQEGQAFLTLCGTSPHYKGLFASVKDANPDRRDRLAALELVFPQVTKTSDLVQRMAEIDQTFEKLRGGRARQAKNAQAADVGHLRLLLDEQFTELLRAHRKVSFVPSDQQARFTQELQAINELIDTLQSQGNQHFLFFHWKII